MSIDINIPGFELIKEIGAGGMATVYLGVQTMLERKVAIKILHQRLSAESEEFKLRFFYEGKVLAKLQHDNIVSIIDIGEADGLLYMAMEYVDGGTLADWLKVQQLTVDQAIQICAKTGLALHATHMKNIVHRDLKPSNILLRDIYTPLLTDFGIARQTDVEHGLTQTGHIVGTLQYMSPEQIRGLHIDHRSDIYSLGLMFYRLLAGRLPFVASGQYELSRMQCEEPPPPLPPELSGLQGVMDAMLAKDPEDRFDSCLDFCKAVQNVSLTDEDYATELTQATRIYESSPMSSPSLGSNRHTGAHSGRYSDRYSDRYSERHSDRRSGQYSDRRSARTSGQYEETRMQGGRTKSGVLKKSLIFGLPSLALIGAAVMYFTIWYVPSSGLSEKGQQRVDNYLLRVEADLSKLQIDSPPRDNAVYELRKALALAPDYQPVLDKARAIAEFYETDARDLLDAGKLDAAVEKTRLGLDIDPGYQDLQQLRQDIENRLADQKRKAGITAALQVAADYVAKGMLISPQDTNAYSAYKKVIALDPQNRAANQGLEAILTQLLDEAGKSIDKGDLKTADTQVQNAASLFTNSIRVTRIRARITAAQTEFRAKQEVNNYLVLARQQMKQGKLIEPKLDNAFNSYREVLNREDNEEASNGLKKIAAIFHDRAGKAMQDGDYRKAANFADSGLMAAPDNPELLKIQQESFSKLGARDREIQSKLQQAQRLVVSGKFLPPGESAWGLFKEVEDMDPGNAQAARGIAGLPDQVFEEANQQQRLGNLRGARDLLKIAQTSFPDQQRFADLKVSMDRAIAQQQKEQRLQNLLDASAKLVASRPMTLDVIDQSAKALKDLNKEFPGNLTAARQVTELITAISSGAREVSVGGNEDAGFVLLNLGLKYFADNQQLLATRKDLKKTRQDRLAEKARQRAALMGQLAIDAVPWGEVTEIRDSAGKPVQGLPTSRSTPLLVSLEAGSYTVSIKNSSGSPKELSVNVIAQQVVPAVAKFNSLTADEYFKRSSW